MAHVASTPALLAPIVSRADAEAFIRELVRLGLDYHFEDGAMDCLHGNGRVSAPTARIIDAQVDRCYAAWEASGADPVEDCPIGYMLDLQKYDEAFNIAAQARLMPGREHWDGPLKKAALECDIPEGPRMDSFISWASDKLTKGE